MHEIKIYSDNAFMSMYLIGRGDSGKDFVKVFQCCSLLRPASCMDKLVYVWRQIGGKQTKIYRFFSTKLVCMGGMYKHSHLDNLPYGHHKKMYS